jgi:hypothetical protein
MKRLVKWFVLPAVLLAGLFASAEKASAGGFSISIGGGYPGYGYSYYRPSYGASYYGPGWYYGGSPYRYGGYGYGFGGYGVGYGSYRGHGHHHGHHHHHHCD